MPFVHAEQSIECIVLPARFPLSKWALLLNELTPELRAKLPPTDDRLRPDMRLFEHGFFHEVSSCGPVGRLPFLRSNGVQGMHSAGSLHVTTVFAFRAVPCDSKVLPCMLMG